MNKNFLVFDIGGTHIKYAIFKRSGDVIHQDKVDTPDNYEHFKIVVQSLIDEYALSCCGVAFSMPGRIDQKQNRIYGGGSLEYNHNRKLTEIFNFHDMMYAVENDAKVSVLAEKWMGTLRDVTDGATIVLGTGIGGGLLINDRLYRGKNYSAGELSAIAPGFPSEVNDMAAIPGSAVLMVKAVNEIVGYSNLTDGINAFKYINDQDSRVMPIFEQFCETIAYVIFNLQVTLDLEKIVLGGGVSDQPIVTETIKQKLDEIYQISPIISNTVIKPEVETMHFKGDANLYGALSNLLLKYELV